jgi:hypothetical protein
MNNYTELFSLIMTWGKVFVLRHFCTCEVRIWASQHKIMQNEGVSSPIKIV